MKKLLVFGMGIASAVVCHAAQIVWTSTQIYTPESAEAHNADPTKALALAGRTTGVYDMVLTFYTSDGAGGWNEYTTVTGTSTDSTKATSLMTTTTSDSFSAGTQYGLVVELTKGDYSLVTDMGTFTPNSAVGNYVLKADGTGFTDTFTFDTQKFDQGAGTWNVPEPTSGMLLLLGMAGLALKRKRA